MAYEVIDEDLRIASCRIADLTMEQVQSFLKLWSDDSSIGSLTMFYDKESDMVVLNADNKNYEDYLQIATAYLGAEYERRKELKEKAPDSMRESMVFLEKCYQQRVFDKRTFQAVNNMLSKTQRKYVTHLLNESDSISAAYIAFRAGMISGKRIERARRAQSHDRKRNV